MFGLFESKRNHFVGLDVGTSAIKMVELSIKNHTIVLENYGTVDLTLASEEASKELKMNTYEDRLRIFLKELTKRMKLDVNGVFVAIPGFSGLIAVVDFPDMKHEELEQAVQYEAHKYIPTSLDEIVLSWDIVGKKEGGLLKGDQKGRHLQVLLVAAPRREVIRYETFIQQAGIKVNAIELETFALVRSLVGSDMGNYLLVDIGSRATNIVLVENGIVMANRNIDAGGSEVTNTIADSLSISRQRAEIFKKGDKDILNSRESIVVPVLELIAGESLRIINAYKEKNKDVKIESIILSGGSSKLKGIDEYFTKTTGIQTIVGNPWRRIIFDKKLTPFISKMGPSFSVAVGLALRGVDEYQRK